MYASSLMDKLIIKTNKVRQYEFLKENKEEDLISHKVTRTPTPSQTSFFNLQLDILCIIQQLKQVGVLFLNQVVVHESSHGYLVFR